MIQSISHIFFSFCVLLSCTKVYCQDWKKVFTSIKNSDTSVIYRWVVNDDHHGAYGEIVLLKSGRFTYNSERPLEFHEYTEGAYTFKKDTLILNSEFQSDNLPIRIEYSDTGKQDRRLSFAYNLANIQLWKARYLFNNDTSIASSYYADLPLDFYPKDFLENIRTLKIEVSPDISSPWMPILNNKKFIHVTVLSRKNFNEYWPKVLKNYKFLIIEDKLIDRSRHLNTPK
jgi:hypothetical protein